MGRVKTPGRRYGDSEEYSSMNMIAYIYMIEASIKGINGLFFILYFLTVNI